MLKEKCSMTDKEWEECSKTRALEMEAVSKALSILSSDDAHDLFTKTFNPALIQTDAASEGSERRNKAAKVLSAIAKKVQNPRLATLATQVRLDAFTRVKKAIDDMVAQLLQEKADEIKHKDFCTDEFNTNQLQLKRAGEDREKQNKEFQTTVADQRETQKMPQAALNVLAEFYGKAALLQQEPA